VAGRRLSKEGRRKRGRDGTTGKRRMGWEKERQSSQRREERVENLERTRQGRPPQLRISSDLREKNRDPFLPSSVYFRGLKGGRRGGRVGGREGEIRKEGEGMGSKSLRPRSWAYPAFRAFFSFKERGF